MLIAGLSAFGAFQPVALRFLNWPDVTGERLAAVKAVMRRRVQALR